MLLYGKYFIKSWIQKFLSREKKFKNKNINKKKGDKKRKIKRNKNQKNIY